LIGSLLVGLQAAKTLAFIYNKPLIPVHHIAGHIYANILENEFKFPLMGLIVSGGHTDLVYMDKHYSFKRIGGTLDDAVGEAYDKVAKVMNLSYPGGPLIDALAVEGEEEYHLPIPLDDDSYNFSFSGLKSAVINLIHNEEQRHKEINKQNLAYAFQKNVIYILVKKTMRALKKYDVHNLLLAGGVAANKGLRLALEEACLKEHINLIVPSLKYCTDNATMIAASAYYAYQKGIKADLDLNAIATIPLDKMGDKINE
jgi:N6-L-threonylcarbamoyladenine synthase